MLLFICGGDYVSSSNERFKEIRKEFGKTQEEWGNLIGITRAGVADIEAGRRNVTEKHLIALKNSEYPINIDWIRTGEGNMRLEMNRNQEVAEFFNDIMEEPDNNFKKRFILAMSKLNEKEWEILAKIAKEMTEEG